MGLANHVLMKGMIKACSLCKVRRHAFLGNAIGQHEPISALDRCWHGLKNTGLLKRDYVTIMLQASWKELNMDVGQQLLDSCFLVLVRDRCGLHQSEDT